MGDVADQLLILHLILQFFLGGLLQTQPHILIIAVQLAHLTVILDLIQQIVKIPLGNLLHGHVQLIDRGEHTLMDPLGQHKAGQQQNQNDGQHHIHQERF